MGDILFVQIPTLLQKCLYSNINILKLFMHGSFPGNGEQTSTCRNLPTTVPEIMKFCQLTEIKCSLANMSLNGDKLASPEQRLIIGATDCRQ